MHIENRVQRWTPENFTLTFVNNVLVFSNVTTNFVLADFSGCLHIAQNFK